CGIGKHGQLGASRHFSGREDCLASKVFHPIKRSLQIFHLSVYGNPSVPVVRGPNAAVDATRSTSGLENTVFHRDVAVNLPAEALAVEGLKFGPFTAHNFKMNNRCSHRSPFLWIVWRLMKRYLERAISGRTIASA